MRLSTKGRYSLRALVDMAQNGGIDNYVSLKSISQRQDISEKYLERIFANLKKSKIVITQRGVQGGYMFSRPLSEISVGEVLRSVEESLALTKCVENDQKICESVNSCVTRKVWKKVTDSIADIVDSMTLEELIEEGGCGGLKGV